MSAIEHNRMAVVVGVASMQDGPDAGVQAHRAAGTVSKTRLDYMFL